MNSIKYEKFNLKYNAKLSLNYLTKMTDKNNDFLPYWLAVPHGKPAYAKHCRVDDAELVASWYEAIVAVRDILNTDEGEEVQEGFYRHIMKSWGEYGLRFHEQYPWAHTNHSSFHEMAYILSALNRILVINPKDNKAEEKAGKLVKGLRSLVIERKVKTFWSGDYEETEPVYEFPNDVYLKDGGFDLTRHTGRGEQSIRNGMMLHALVVRWEIAQDEVALDLATGMANYLLGVSRYFNYKMEFFGHVHSAVWIASGLVRLGRVTNNLWYTEKGKGIYDYVRKISSTFGWVPEYAQWHADSEEHCETCCIKDMIECGLELTAAGYDEYWDTINKYTRNQLIENQIKDGSFVPVDNTLLDTEDTTYKEMDIRTVGGFSGGAEPNTISLKRFRSVAGCCAGTAPQAMQLVWNQSVVDKNNCICVNMPIDKDGDSYKVETGYPNEGWIKVTTKSQSDIKVRIFKWMGKSIKCYIDGEEVNYEQDKQMLIIRDIKQNSNVIIKHELETVKIKEMVRGKEFTVFWRGSDVVDISPKGDHIRLYQREKGVPKYYPTPDEIQISSATVVATPSEQKK